MNDDGEGGRRLLGYSPSYAETKKTKQLTLRGHVAWWLIGRFGTFRLKGRRFESRSSCHIGDRGQVLHWQLPVALRHETPTQYPCCVWSIFE